LLAVDDASSDDTPARLAERRDPLRPFAPADRCRQSLTARHLDSIDGILLFY
jgi:hypothetical protein